MLSRVGAGRFVPSLSRWLCAGVVLALPLAALAATTLQGRVIANGGTTQSQGGDYTLAGTIAEPVAGASGNGTLQLDSGFWQPALAPLPEVLFSDGFED